MYTKGRQTKRANDEIGDQFHFLHKIGSTAVTDTASEILGKHRQKKKPWNTAEILDLWKEKTEKEKIWAWMMWEIQESEQQHQDVHEKG